MRAIGLLPLYCVVVVHAQDLRWSELLTVQMAGNDILLGGSASNTDGRLAIAGGFSISASIGSQTLTKSPPGGSDGYLFVIDSTGTLLWYKQFHGQRVICGRPEVDAVGNVYISVEFTAGATYSFNGGSAGTQSWSYRYAVIKFDPLGNLVQRTVISVPNLEWPDHFGPVKMVASPSGELCVTGTFSTGTALTVNGPENSLTVTAPGGGNEPFPFILKLQASGDPAWGHAFGDGHDLFFRALDTDDAGNTYIAADLRDAPGLDLDPTSNVLTPDIGGGQDGVLFKFGPTGAFLWAKQLDANGSFLNMRALTCVPGHIYLAGDFSGQADLDPGSAVHLFSSAHHYDGFVLALDADGGFQQAHQLSGINDQQCTWVGVNAQGDLYGAGVFNDTLLFDGLHTSLTASDYQYFLLKLTPAGQLPWLATLPGASYQQPFPPPDPSFASGGSPFFYALIPITATTDVDLGPGVHLVSPVQGSMVWALIQYGSAAIVGCMDPGSMNYTPTAVVDNGTCTHPGCTDPAALNFSPTANWNDGSCHYLDPACRSDLNADGVVNVIDFGIFVSEFNTSCP